MLQVRMFGSIEITDPERGRVLGPRDLGGKKPRQLLEILLLERGRRVSKQRVADLLWADRPPQNYSATVESYVSVLRRTLNPGGSPRDSLILTDRGGYRFADERARVDLDLFDDLLAKCDTDAAQVAMDRLTEAIDLVKGEILEDDPYAEWVQDAREAHMPRLMGALVSAGECALTLGDPVHALRLADRALARDSLVEAASRIAMVASYRLGRQEDAVRTFHRCRETLDQELGVAPMPDTSSLYFAIERHDDALMHCGSPSSADDVSSACVFLGRSEQLAELDEQIAHALSGCFSLVLVEGEGGIGASRFLEEALRVRLGPLSRGELSGVGLTALYEPTGGHPLLLAEAVRGSFEDEPAGLGAEVRSRLAGYCAETGPDRFTALSAAAKLAQPFSREALAAELDVAELGLAEDLELLCEANILRST